MLTRIGLGGIWVYQTFLSPHKGYRCAYSVVHGGSGCSGYVKHTLRDDGIWHGWPKIRTRFEACRQAYATLLEERSQNADTKRRKRSDTCMECTTLGCAGSALPCGGATADTRGDGSGCGTNPCGDGCSCDINPCN